MRAGRALLMLAAVLAATPASAQTLETPRGRQGYYLGLGLHGMANHAWDDGDGLGVWGGSAFTLRFGQLLTRRFGLGLQIFSGGTTKGQQQASVFGLEIESQWELAWDLALHGGVGLGVLSLDDKSDPDEGLRGTVGAGYFLGLSYDFWPRRKRLTGGLAVTPMVQVRGIPGDSGAALMALFGVQVAWWTGLPREQLELPDSEAYKKP
jgi:hypothetical protein